MANITQFNWTAPTHNTDGTLIDYPLDYELGLWDGTEFVPISVFPGTLNPDGTYFALISDFAVFTVGASYTVAARAINRLQPAAISDWSESLDFTLSNGIPNPPLNLAGS